MTRRVLAKTLTLASAGLALALSTSSSMAASLPCHAVRLIIPANAGGATDTLGRIMADTANRLGASPALQVVNVGGQATMKGSIEAARSKPDGCTILLTHESLLQAPLVSGAKVSYESFDPIAQMTTNPQVIAAGSATPFNTVKDLVEAAKAKPNTILAGASLGGVSHFSLLVFQEVAGVAFKYVSYNGAQDALTALLGNHIELIAVQPADIQEGVKSGQIKPMVVLSANRVSSLPDVPTAMESGYDVIFELTHVLFAPKGTPADVTEYYRALFEKVSNDPQYRTQIAAVGATSAYMAPAAAKDVLATKQARFADLAKRMDMLPK